LNEAWVVDDDEFEDRETEVEEVIVLRGDVKLKFLLSTVVQISEQILIKLLNDFSDNLNFHTLSPSFE
jgi:hypothetical protein